MPDEGLLEAPETEDVDLGTESTEGTEESTAEGTETQTETQTQTRDDSAPVISDANGQLKLSETARAELDKIKAENPRLAREMRAALFDRQALLAKVPGGVKEALATIEAYEAEGEERQRLWVLDVSVYPPRNHYAQRAGNRRIPVMVLPPARVPTG